MLSLFTSLPLSIISDFVMNPMFILGYAVCVIFPVPFLNSFILSLWGKFGGQIMAAFRSFTGKAATTVETTVVTAVETAVANAIVSKL